MIKPEDMAGSAKGGIVCDAISKRLRVSFTYLGRRRTVEPHLCGRTGAGEEMLLAYLVGGYSLSGSPLGWRNYRLTKVRDVEILKDGFGGTRPGFNPHDPRFAVVYCRLPNGLTSAPQY